jgi:hypothetical protein
MAKQSLDRIRAIWVQDRIPVIYRKGKGFPLYIKVPYREDNRSWLQNNKRTNPKWIKDKKRWEIPKAWFNDIVNRALDRFGSLYIIQPHAAHEICARACWEAQGHECQCSCLGEHHGSQSPGGRWFEVSETFAVKYEEKELACRFLQRKK